MAEKDWRMVEPCEKCPFNASGPGLALRKTLRPARWREITRGLKTDHHFFCHATTRGEETDDGDYTPNGQEKYCAGALAYEDQHGLSTNYRRVCETLDAFAASRATQRRLDARRG